MTRRGSRSATSDALRVAIVFGTFPPERNGGADFVGRFAPALAAHGVEVHVVTSPSPERPEEERIGSGVTVHRVVDDWTLSRRGRRKLAAVDDLIASARIDVVHVFFPDSVLQARYQLPAAVGLGRAPLVTTFWNLGLGRRSPPETKLAALALLARSAVLTSHDPAYLRTLSVLAGWACPVRWLPVGSNVGQKAGRDRSEVRAHLALDDRPAVGYFGQLDFTRGAEDLFAAVAALRAERDLRLVMVGTPGPREGAYRRRAEDLEIADRVRWTGYLPAGEAADTLAALDLCVLPYRRNSLGRSALAAALELGVPTVLAGTPAGIAPLRPGTHVALVPPGDVPALTSTLRRLAADEPARASLAAGARRAARLFQWDRIAAAALSIYAEARRKTA